MVCKLKLLQKLQLKYCLFLIYLIVIHIPSALSANNSNSVPYKLATVPFTEKNIGEKYKKSAKRIPQTIEDWIQKKASSMQLIVLEREQYDDVLEEVEFENKRKEDFDSSSMIQRLRSLGANIVLTGSIEQDAGSDELLVTAKIVSIETMHRLAKESLPIKYSTIDSGYKAVVDELNIISGELYSQFSRYNVELSIKDKRKVEEPQKKTSEERNDNETGKDKQSIVNTDDEKENLLLDKFNTYKQLLLKEKTSPEYKEKTNDELICTIDNIIRLFEQLKPPTKEAQEKINKDILLFKNKLNKRMERQEYYKLFNDYEKIKVKHR